MKILLFFILLLLHAAPENVCFGTKLPPANSKIVSSHKQVVPPRIQESAREPRMITPLKTASTVVSGPSPVIPRTPVRHISFSPILNPFGYSFPFSPVATITCPGGLCNRNNYVPAATQVNQVRQLRPGDVTQVRSGDITCVGQLCNQNNGRRRRNTGFGGFNLGLQRCFGSQCNQNNIGSNPRFGNFNFGQLQRCVGSQCNQNNVASFGQVQQCHGSQCNQNNLAGNFGALSLCNGRICGVQGVGSKPFGLR